MTAAKLNADEPNTDTVAPMIQPPPKPFTVMGLRVELAGDATETNFAVRFATEGGGFYPVIEAAGCIDPNTKTEHAIAFNPDELTALAKWCEDVCKRLDLAHERNASKDPA